MNRWYSNGVLATLGGFCALCIAMGVGRFVYTVLLPEMMHTYSFAQDVAGAMASWNYMGYLLGVMAVRYVSGDRWRYLLLASFLLVSIFTTVAMGWGHTPLMWYTIRFLSGVASGVCFVLSSSIVLDTLLAIQRPKLAGFLYSGVGTGIALGALAAGPLAAMGDISMSWVVMGLLCLPLLVVALITLRPQVNSVFLQDRNNHSEKQREQEQAVGRQAPSFMYKVLLLVYFLEGAGYIIGVTFLVALVETTTNSSDIARMSWVITGLAAALSAPIWRFVAGGKYLPMLVVALLLQGLGVLLPTLSSFVAAVFISGLLLGGTFMGITVLSLQYGVSLSGEPSVRTVANMTAIYGIGQIFGPLIVVWQDRDHDFSFPFFLSAMMLFAGALILFAGNKLSHVFYKR